MIETGPATAWVVLVCELSCERAYTGVLGAGAVGGAGGDGTLLKMAQPPPLSVPDTDPLHLKQSPPAWSEKPGHEASAAHTAAHSFHVAPARSFADGNESPHAAFCVHGSVHVCSESEPQPACQVNCSA